MVPLSRYFILEKKIKAHATSEAHAHKKTPPTYKVDGVRGYYLIC